VDDFGIRRFVTDPGVTRVRYFANEPVVTVTREEIHRLPIGRSLSVSTGPDLFAAKDESAVMLNGKPRILLEWGSGPTAKRIEIDNVKNLKNIDDLEDLEDLEDVMEK